MIKLLLICCTACLFTSCSNLDGRLYTDKVIPYSRDFNETPVGVKKFVVDDFKVKEPVSGYNITAEWMTSNLIKEAEKAGVKKVYYADMRIFSILMGIYSKKTLIVYGK